MYTEALTCSEGKLCAWFILFLDFDCQTTHWKYNRRNSGLFGSYNVNGQIFLDSLQL